MKNTMKRSLLLLCLVGMAIALWADEASEDTAVSATVRYDSRTTFGARILHGTERISPVAIEYTTNARLFVDGNVTNGWTIGDPQFNSTAIRKNGWHRFALEEGENTTSTELFVLNDDGIVIHGGVLKANETWAADKVHIVRHWVRVPEGVTLTVEANAVVKFCEDTGLQIDGTIVANKAVFTYISDDTAGGDTEQNGTEGVLGYGLYEITGDGDMASLTNCDLRYSSTLPANTTWKSGDVIHVIGTLSVPSGMTLTIQKGGIVKFATGAKLITAGGGIIDNGAVFTHLADDSEDVGGDTNGDGDATIPVHDAYELGFDPSSDSDVRFKTLTYEGGTINAGETVTLAGNRIYNVTGDIIVKNGGKLVVRPGAILKMWNWQRQIIVESGGVLEAIGNRARPIVFTSLRDDAHGGDTNGDGEETVPNGGDWKYIYIQGYAKLAYCTLMYGAPSNETGIVRTAEDGVLEMDCCIVAHAEYDGIWNWGGSVTVHNSIIMDTGLGAAPYRGVKNEYINCVFYETQHIAMYWSTWSGMPVFTNCVFKNIGSEWIDTNGYSDAYDIVKFRNCLFHNDEGYTNQSFSKTGSDGNIWADPLFTDDMHGDFTLKAGSPCIDAGDGTVAPAMDYWGRPRMDVVKVADTGKPDEGGICPDIGVYEMQGAYNGPCPNLAVTDVSVPAEAISGGNITVTWTITNEGDDNAVGPWRDIVVLQSVDESLGAQCVTIGEVVVENTLLPQNRLTVKETFTLPPLKAGNWRIGVTTNAYRDVYEVKRADNQSFAKDATAVMLPVWSSANNRFSVGSYGETGFTLPSSAAARIVKVTLPIGAKISAYGADGYLPSAASSDVKSITLSNGTLLLYVPANSQEAYVTLANESAVSATAAVSVEDAVLSLLDAAPMTVLNRGTSTMRVVGTRLSANSVFKLACGATTVTGELAALTDGLVAAVQFNVNGIAVGDYTLSVTEGGRTASLKDKITVTADGVGPNLEAWLETPPAVRDGRIYTAWLCYKNSGDADMTMPMFEVTCGATTRISYTLDGEFASRPLRYAGVSPTAPAGVLKAGDENRLPVFFSLEGNYKIGFATIAQENTPHDTFGTWANYADAMARTATRLNARGKEEYRGSVIFEQATLEAAGTVKSAISGHAKDLNTGVPLEGVTIHCYGTDDETGMTTVTDANGWFVFDNLDYGAEYELLSESGLQEENLAVATPTTGELTGVVLQVKKLPAIHGWVLTEADDMPLEGMEVVLYSDGFGQNATTDFEGRFSFENVMAGDYTLQATPADGYAGEEQAITVTEADGDRSFYLRLEKGSMVHGVVTLEKERLPLPGVTVMAMCAATGATYTAVTDDDGVYTLSGLPVGRNWLILSGGGYEAAQRVAVDIPEEEITEIEQNITAVKAAPFVAMPSQGPAPLSVKIYAMEEDFSAKSSDWRWDFDGDGKIDYRGAKPEWTYTQPGKYDITVWYVDAEGNEATAVKRGAVEVRKPVETIVKDDVIILTDSTDYELVAVTENTLTLKVRKAVPAKAVSVGSVLVSGADTAHAFSRKVVSMTRTGSTLELITDQAQIDELFKQCDITIVGEFTDDDLVESSATRGKTRGEGGTQWDPVVVDLQFNEFGIEVIPFMKMPEFEHNFRCNDGKLEQVHLALVIPTGVEFKEHYRTRGRVSSRLKHNIFKFRKDQLFLAGYIPIWTSETLDINLFLRLEAMGQVSIEASQKVTRYHRIGFELNLNENFGFIPLLDDKYETQLTGPDIKFMGNLKLSGGLEAVLDLKLYEGLLRMKLGGELGLWAKLGPAKADSSRLSYSIGHTAKAYLNVSVLYTDSEVFKWLKVNKSTLSRDIVFGFFEVPWHEWYAAKPEFTYSPTTDIEKDDNVSFIDKSLKGDEGFKVTKWKWSFGDGGYREFTSQSQMWNLSHSYSDERVYVASLQLESEHLTYNGKYEKRIAVGVEDDEAPKEDPSSDENGASKKSIDPNEISGMIGLGDSGTQRFVKPGEWLDYTVYFENKSTAAAPAQEVTVTHQLSKWLDWSSLELGEIAFNNQIQLELKGKARGTAIVPQNDTNYHVQMTAATDETTGGFTLYLRSYDKARQAFGYWPESVYAGFLPPNDGTHRGEGHVSFRVKVRDDAPEGAFINAEATIVFDMNEPITTAPAWFNWVTTAENPVADPTTLRWDTSEDMWGTTYIVNYWMGDPDPTSENTTVTFNSDTLSNGSFQLPDGLAFGTYYWNVTKKRNSTSSNTSTWSFELLPTHAVTVVNGSGSGTYKQQTVVTATATGMDGRIFSGWTAEGITLSDSERYATVLVFVMPDNDVTLTANYDLVEGEIPLLPGWNLVAAPGNLDRKYNALAFSELRPFVYDKQNKAYVSKSLPLNGGEAMWLYSRAARNVPLVYEDEGSVVGGLTDRRGWQMVGVGGEEDVTLDHVAAAWQWSAGKWKPLEINGGKVLLKAGRGYFIYKE